MKYGLNGWAAEAAGGGGGGRVGREDLVGLMPLLLPRVLRLPLAVPTGPVLTTTLTVCFWDDR